MTAFWIGLAIVGGFVLGVGGCFAYFIYLMFSGRGFGP